MLKSNFFLHVALTNNFIFVSDFSNDDLDDDPNADEDDDDPSSSLALSYKSSTTVTNYQQSRIQYRNPRSITPEMSFDDHDLLSVNRSNSMKKSTTRSLTPDKRPLTPEQPFSKSLTAKLTASQTSLMSRQSSGSRQSTLERQLKRYDESRISRSSSSSSDDVGGGGGGLINRQSRRPPFKASNNGDYKIRRSRWAHIIPFLLAAQYRYTYEFKRD